MNRHIVILGGPRAATYWISCALRDNAMCAVDVTHEGLFCLDETLDRWNQDGVHINVGHDGYVMAEFVHERFPDAEWHFVHRDPVAHYESIVRYMLRATPPDGAGRGHGRQLTVAHHFWSAAEQALRRLEALDRPVRHWHVDAIGEPRGFQAFARALKLPVRPDFVEPEDKNVATNPDEYVVDPHVDRVLKLFSSFEKLMFANVEALTAGSRGGEDAGNEEGKDNG